MLTIVMGPTCSGKSHLIREKYTNAKIVDLYDFQRYGMSVSEVWQSYVDCAEALKVALKENDNVVLEHTLLKRIRREWYFEQIREVYSGDIHIVCMYPTAEQLSANAKKRGLHMSLEQANDMLQTLEFPSEDEGYASINIVET